MEEKELKAVLKVVTDSVALSRSEGAAAFTGVTFDEREVYSDYASLFCQSMQL